MIQYVHMHKLNRIKFATLRTLFLLERKDGGNMGRKYCSGGEEGYNRSIFIVLIDIGQNKNWKKERRDEEGIINFTGIDHGVQLCRLWWRRDGRGRWRGACSEGWVYLYWCYQ